MYEKTYGPKYEATKDLHRTDLAKLMREDIKAAVKAGRLPKGIKVSIRCRDSSIDMKVMALPFKAFVRVWDPEYKTERREHTPEAEAALTVLKEIHWAYNFDGSEIQSDYFNVRYYGTPGIDWQLEKRESDAAAAVAAPLPTPTVGEGQ